MGFFRDWDLSFWATSKNHENPKDRDQNLKIPKKSKAKNPEILGITDRIRIGF